MTRSPFTVPRKRETVQNWWCPGPVAAQGNYSTSAFLKIAFNTARGGLRFAQRLRERMKQRAALPPPRVKKVCVRLSPSLSELPSSLEDGRTKRTGRRESKPGVEWPKRRVKRRGREIKGGKRERGKKWRRQEVEAKKGGWIKERGGEEGGDSLEERGGDGQRGWISFRLVPLMSVMRAAGPLLPF